jgi:peptidoglycan/xylan/chitin deacetylase (PgdA/CDA1 family)
MPEALPEKFMPEPRFKWPDGKRCALLFCFDVDGETTALSEDPNLVSKITTMSQCEYGPNIGVPRILELLKHYDVPGTFFIPSYIVEQHPKMTQRIHEDGHELAAHGHLHEKLASLNQTEEAAVLDKSLQVFEDVVGFRPTGYRAPWFEINPWTTELLKAKGFRYNASMMADDVPFLHPNQLIELPAQWMMEDWEQFAFNPDPAWGVIPEDTDKVFKLWWNEFMAMRDYGCCCLITLHPWLSGRPSRVQLIERIIREALKLPDVWITNCSEVADYLSEHPDARREINLDV